MKKINDIYGHEEGDFALKTAGTVLRSCFRKDDIVARFGGDEFVALAILQDVDTLDYKERIENAINLENERCVKPYYIEMSMGVYSFVCNEELEVNEIIKRADLSLYLDKRSKRLDIKK